MKRVHKKHRTYKDKEFHVQSLTHLVKLAKEKTIETISSDGTAPPKLAIHQLTERLTHSLQHMHHQLQGLLMQKLGPDARNIIAAERHRQARTELGNINHDDSDKEEKQEMVIAKHLSEVGKDAHDEIHQLNEYRQRYAVMLAELEVAKENMVELEHRLED